MHSYKQIFTVNSKVYIQKLKYNNCDNLKGISLPVNALVIIVLAVIILIAILALFYGLWPSGVSGVTLGAVKNNACQILLDTGCVETRLIQINNFDADKDGTNDPGIEWTWGTVCPTGPADAESGDNLASLCECYYPITDDIGCKELCNC